MPVSSAVENLVLKSTARVQQITRQLADAAGRTAANDAAIASQEREMAELRASLGAHEENLQVGFFEMIQMTDLEGVMITD